MSPTRARPVPLCPHRFLCPPPPAPPPPDSKISPSLTRPPNTASSSSSDPTFVLSPLTISSFMSLGGFAPSFPACLRLLNPLHPPLRLGRHRLANDEVAARRAPNGAAPDEQMLGGGPLED